MSKTRIGRTVAIGLAGLALALTAGCSDSGDSASDATSSPAVMTAEQRLDAVWNAQVLSSDRAATCALTGDEQLQAFRTQVEPWLTGLPADSMPSEADMQSFLTSACSQSGASGAASPAPSAS